MSDIDSLLQIASKELFHDLDPLHRRILERLAKDGPLGVTKLGGDKRWNVDLRLHGTERTIGLIPHNFVREVKVKTRPKFDLTLKGLLAVLATTKFENIKMIDKYKRTFLEKVIEKPQIVGWSLDFIKYEIALILYYNYLQGLNWTKFKYVERYWYEFKTYSPHTIRTFFLHQFYDKKTNEKYDMIEKQYLTLFSILDYCTYFINWWLSTDIDPHFPSDESFRTYVDRWFSFINGPDLSTYKSPEFEYEWNDRHGKDWLDSDEFFESKLDEHRKIAKESLQKNGHEIKAEPRKLF